MRGVKGEMMLHHPPSPTPSSLFVDLDPDLDEATDPPTPLSGEAFGEFDDLDLETMEKGTVVVDRGGQAWIWRECLCNANGCGGMAWRPVEGKTALNPEDRGRFEGGEE
jgi:hypothetical protein